MKTLILGHGRNYNEDYIRCSPIDIKQWYYDEYICVDIDPTANPDIVYDLKKEWSFCDKIKYDRIIDTSGIALGGGRYKYTRSTIKNKLINCLHENGIFYGNNVCWQNKGGILIDYNQS
jgi:hypothetical protein